MRNLLRRSPSSLRGRRNQLLHHERQRKLPRALQTPRDSLRVRLRAHVDHLPRGQAVHLQALQQQRLDLPVPHLRLLLHLLLQEDRGAGGGRQQEDKGGEDHWGNYREESDIWWEGGDARF